MLVIRSSMKAILSIVTIIFLTFQASLRQELFCIAHPDQYAQLQHKDPDMIQPSFSVFSKKTAAQQEDLWESMLKRSRRLNHEGLNDSAVFIGNQVVEECQKAGNRLFYIRALLNLSIIRQENYKYEEAIKNLALAEKLLRRTDPIEVRFNIKNQQGFLQYHMGNYPTAIQYFQEIHHQLLRDLDFEQKCAYYNNLGLVYLNMSEFQRADSLFRKAKAEANAANSPSSKIITTFNLGKFYLKKKQYSKAWNLIMKSLQVFQEQGDVVHSEEASRLMGSIYMEQGNYTFALNYFKQSLELARQMRNPRIILENYRNIFTNYNKIRQEKNDPHFLLLELEYFKKWAYLNDSLYQDQTTERIMELEKQYETEKKNNQIRLLEKEKQMAEEKIKSGQTQRQYLFILVALILIVLFFFIYSFSYYKKMTHLLQKQSRRIMNQQAQITRQNEKLQKAVGTQNKLFSIMAHDLRSPLVSLSNLSKLINLYIRNNRYDDAWNLSRQMDRKNDHLLELTDNLLSWTKTQSDNFKPYLEKVRLQNVITECLKIYEIVSSDKEISMDHEIEEDILLKADHNMLQTVLRNLINNAIKFTPRKGQIRIFCHQENLQARITVQDTGIGIPKEKLGKIFEIDINNIQSGTEGEKSSGLGLSVCREFIEMMGGQIYAESEEDRGSSFIFTIPLYQDHEKQNMKQFS